MFHALYDAQGPDVYTMQLLLNLDGPLDAAALKAAVRRCWQRHASLRAGFQHENLSRPVQIIVPSPSCRGAASICRRWMMQRQRRA